MSDDWLKDTAYRGLLSDVVAEQELEPEFWCVIFMESAHVDLVLQPQTIGRVAALGATLRLDIYAPADAEPDVIEIPEPGASSEALDAD